MSDHTRRTIGDWFATNVATILTALAMLVGLTVYASTVKNSNEEVKRRLDVLETRYNTEVVPRKEHEEKDRMLADRLTNIETLLRELLARQR